MPFSLTLNLSGIFLVLSVPRGTNQYVQLLHRTRSKGMNVCCIFKTCKQNVPGDFLFYFFYFMTCLRDFREGCDAIKTETFSRQSGEHVTAYLLEKQLCLEP